MGAAGRGGGVVVAAEFRCIAAATATATSAAAAATTGFSARGAEDFGPGGGSGAHKAWSSGQGLKAVLTGQHGHMTQATTAGAGSAEQFVDILALALAGEFHQAQLTDLSDLRAC
jgi:hypothetical protein